MIVVTVGTNEARFDRLLRAVAELDVDEPLFVQHGPSDVRPPNAECVDYLSFAELVERLRRARVVVTHAGVGSVVSALSAGKVPIVVPRLRRFGEAVDDHQVPFGRLLERQQLVRFVEDPARLAAAVAERRQQEHVEVRVNERLVAGVRDCVERALSV